MGLLKTRRSIGLDIGSSSVKVVELDASRQGYRLHRFGYAALPVEAIVQGAFMDTAAISAAIEEAMAGSRGMARNVATSVSGHSVIVKKLTLPAQSHKELEETIHWEAEQHIPFDIDEVNIDYQIVGEDAAGGEMDIILVAAKKDLIDGYLGVICDAGLNLAILDVDAFAMGNMHDFSEQPDEESAVALIDIGASVVNINVMSGGVPVFTRDLTTGGNSYTEAIQKNLSLSFEEAETIKLGGNPDSESAEIVPREVEDCMQAVSEGLLAEIIRSLEFYSATSSQRPIQRAVLCGGGSRVPGLDRMLEELAEFPVQIADPFSRIEIPKGFKDQEKVAELAPALSVAVGLAIRGVNES